MAHPRERVERVEKRSPLFAQRGKLAAPCGRQSIVAAVASSLIRLPATFDQSALFHLVKQRVERGEGEFQRAPRAFADLLGDFKAIKWLFCQQGKNGEFSAAPGDFRADAFGHVYIGILCCKYRIPILGGQRYVRTKDGITALRG